MITVLVLFLDNTSTVQRTVNLQKNSRQQGFTLIELSIVLVIIGLVTAGVLVGKDLINQAELRSIITDVEKYNTAVNTFKVKYCCLAGDCPFATDFLVHKPVEVGAQTQRLAVVQRVPLPATVTATAQYGC
ncbi:MAG: type II secretion system protein [Alphaproteobacteria bacterium]